MSYKTTHNLLYDDLDLSKKSVRGWNNSSVHTTAVVRNWPSVHTVLLLQQASYSHELTPLDLFLILRVKELPAGITITTSRVKIAADGVADYDCLLALIAAQA